MSSFVTRISRPLRTAFGGRGPLGVRTLARVLTCGLVATGFGASVGLAQSAEEAPRFKPLPPPSLNFYGSAGLLDMPSGEMLPDGQFTTTLSYFGGNARYNLTFQALPWMSASFRYNSIKPQTGLMFGFETYYDRGFDVRFRLLRERRWLPAVTMGLQDFAGTGVYAAEYFVATKTFDTPAWGAGTLPGRLKLTAGLGWGRLGSHGAIGNIGGKRPSFVGGSTGGQLAYNQWFRGDFAPFGGIEWQVNERWGLKAEYSSDAYITETRAHDVFQRKSSMNFGLEYQVGPRTRLGAYYLYGSEIGVTAQIQLNPKHSPTPMMAPAPVPVVPRSDWATEPAHWSQDWAASESSRVQVRDLVAEALKPDGLILEALDVSGVSAEVRYRNNRYRSDMLAVGRVARVMARVLPPSVETFRIVPVRKGMGLSTTVLRRSDLEALEFDANSSDALLAVTGFASAGPVADSAIQSGELYPAFATSISPYAAPAYFDPAQPFRLDVGVDFAASYAPAPGWFIGATLRQRALGNVKNGRASNSRLPHVRTDQVHYAQYGRTLENLYVARSWKPGKDLYARATLGYFESMYGGISGELLWKPVSSRLALGIEGNYVVQRDFDQRLGFRDYKTFTGHGSAYYELPNGYQAQVDVGRYLAGDYGATFGVDRVFANGWSVGGFFTRTNVSAADFGEGSFDKGFRFRIPLDWMLGRPSRNAFGITVRPVQRDGGQRVAVPGRLYGQIRAAHRASLEQQGAKFWE